LAARPAAHIVNISSIFGIIAPAGQTAYCASKFAVRGFSEALRHEFWLNKSPINLTVVHPGGIKTNIVRNSRMGVTIATDNARRVESIERFDTDFAKTTAQVAAQTIIKGIEKNAPRVLIGGDAKFMDLLQRFRPGTYFRVLQKRITAPQGAQGK
jgi:short-subunit dehydrogenase